MKYVHFTRGSYKVRVTVPPELRASIGKRELTENLGADKRLAERRSHAVIARFLVTIEDAREQADANRPTLSTLAKRYFQQQLELDDQGRQELGHDVVAGLHETSMPILASQMRLVMSGQLTGEPAEELVAGLSELLEKEGCRPDMPHAELIKLLAGVELDALAAGQALDQYQITLPTPRSPLLAEPDPEPVQLVNKEKPGGKGPTLSDILTAFHKERQAGRNLADKTKDEHRSPGEGGEVQHLFIRAHEAVAGHEGEQPTVAVHRHEADGKARECGLPVLPAVATDLEAVAHAVAHVH